MRNSWEISQKRSTWNGRAIRILPNCSWENEQSSIRYIWRLNNDFPRRS